MRILHTLPVLALTCLTFAQKPTLKPSDWRKTNLAPADFAKRVDSAILNVKNALGQAAYRCELFDGSKGGAVFMNRIRDRKTFRVEFCRLERGNISAQSFVGKDGALYLLTTGYTPLKPGANPGLVPTNISPVLAWPFFFQQAMFQCYVTDKGAFQPFVQALLKGDGGFSVRMESRVMSGGNRSVPQVRLFAKRSPALAKKLGNATIEIVTDAGRFLPMQVRVNLVDKKGKKALFEWVSAWQGPVRFDNKWFTIPRA